MTENILRVKLGELQIVRVICKRENCGGVAEFPFDALSHFGTSACECPVCKTDFRQCFPPNENAFRALGLAIESMLGRYKTFEIEFPIHMKIEA